MAEGKQCAAVGMSGGVDSSMAAALLLDAGYDVKGFTLVLHDRALRCVSQQDAEKAARVADALGIEHEVVDARDVFERTVISYFVDTYASGRTPSPCVLCNPTIKFGFLLEHVRGRGCDYLATGHYVRKKRHNGYWQLLRGVDEKKDQSYFLHRLSQEQLGAALFPLGGLRKPEVRRAAAERELPVAQHGESQDLCFVDENAYAELVESYRPDVVREGKMVNHQGGELGSHNGLHRYTIGQRKGLGIAAGLPLYVSALRPETHEVVVAPREGVMHDACEAGEVTWIAGSPPADEFRCRVHVRYRHEGSPARVTVRDEGRQMQIVFDEPQFAITPGQAAVCYDGDEVLGGGWILSAGGSGAGER
jgi:tRNA-specific 2-thiouridylase